MGDNRTYKNPPEMEVFCKIDFPPILKVSSEPPSEFQEKIREEYPIYLPEIGQGISIDSGDLARPPTVLTATWNTHSFRKEKDAEIVTVAVNSFFFSTKKYDNWSDFKKRLLKLLGQFSEVYRPQQFMRVGLMYRNVFIRSQYNLLNESWTDLINSEFLGQLSKEYADHSEYSSVCELKFKDCKERARTNIVIVVNSDKNVDKKEQCLLVDNDIFIVDRVSPDDIENVLDKLHIHAKKLFRSIPTEKLEKAMEPID